VGLAKATNMKAEIMQRVADKMRRTLYYLRGWITAPSGSKPAASETGPVTDKQGPSWRDRDPSMP